MIEQKEKKKVNKIIALMGKAGSGKDTILQELITKLPDRFNEIVSCTSRPRREGEKDGINYHFMTDADFLDQVKQGRMLEWTNFNNWYYGTSKDSLSEDKINVGVFNPAGIKQLIGNTDIAIKVFYVRAPDKERLLRQLNRENNPDIKEIMRRYQTDEADFDTLLFPYTEINNNTPSDLNSCVAEICRNCLTF